MVPLFAALIVLARAAPAAAQAWPEPRGHGFVITTFTYTNAQNNAGIPNPASGQGTFTRYAVTPYVEYGLTDKLTIGGAPRYEWLNLSTATGNQPTNGFSDIDLFARQVLWSDPSSVLSVQGLISVPTGYDPNANPALGDDQVDLEPRLLFGHGFSLAGWSSFIDLEAAYRFRLSGPADEVRFSASMGTHLTDNFLLLAQSFNIVGMNNEAPGQTDFNLFTFALSGVYDLSPGWAVQLGGFTEYAGRNYNTGNGLITGVWWRF
jgi:protein XagA